MPSYRRFYWLAFVLLALVAGRYIFARKHAGLGNGRKQHHLATALPWSLLATGSEDQASPEAKKFDGDVVRMAGFMVPLEGDAKGTWEFLLIPTLPSCAHVPPPPPNQTVLVRMDDHQRVEPRFSPIWVRGRFHANGLVIKDFGGVAYTFSGDAVDDYELELGGEGVDVRAPQNVF